MQLLPLTNGHLNVACIRERMATGTWLKHLRRAQRRLCMVVKGDVGVEGVRGIKRTGGPVGMPYDYPDDVPHSVRMRLQDPMYQAPSPTPSHYSIVANSTPSRQPQHQQAHNPQITIIKMLQT